MAVIEACLHCFGMSNTHGSTRISIGTAKSEGQEGLLSTVLLRHICRFKEVIDPFICNHFLIEIIHSDIYGRFASELFV